MKSLILIIVCVFSAATLSAQMTAGTWNTGQQNTIVETYEKDGAWFGKVVSSDNPKVKIGLEILRGFKLEDEELKGKMFAAKRNKEFDAVIDPSDEKLLITISAGFMTRKLTWERDLETKSN